MRAGVDARRRHSDRRNPRSIGRLRVGHQRVSGEEVISGCQVRRSQVCSAAQRSAVQWRAGQSSSGQCNASTDLDNAVLWSAAQCTYLGDALWLALHCDKRVTSSAVGLERNLGQTTAYCTMHAMPFVPFNVLYII